MTKPFKIPFESQFTNDDDSKNNDITIWLREQDEQGCQEAANKIDALSK